MKNLDYFLEYKLVEYMRNYSENLLISERPTSNETIRFFADISMYILRNIDRKDKQYKKFQTDLMKTTKRLLKYVKYNHFSLNENGMALSYLEKLKIYNTSKQKKVGKNPPLTQKVINDFLEEYLKISIHYLKHNQKLLPDCFTEVFKLFQLDEVEQELLSVVFVAETCSVFNGHIFHEEQRKRISVFEDSSYASGRIKVQHQRIEFVTNVSHRHVKLNFREKSKLFLTGLLENEDDPNFSDFLIDYIEGVSDNCLLDNIYEQVDLTSAFPLKANQLTEKDIINLKNMLQSKNGIALLLKGLAGTGKTELVKSLAKELEFPLFNLKQARKDDDSNIPPRKMAMYLIQQLYKNQNVLFLVDECESLINSPKKYNFFSDTDNDEGSNESIKTYINEYLDENQCKIVFIANNTEQVDDSTMRRFNYIGTFKGINSEHREVLLNNLFAKENLDFLSLEEIKVIATSSKLNIGHFGIAAKTVKDLNLDVAEKKDLFLDIVNNHSKEFIGTGIVLKKLSSAYLIDGLNADHDLKVMSEKLGKYHKKIISSETDVSLNILLSGPPGSGKTEYAKYLSQELKIGFIFKQASDLVSKYVGETEQNIKAAFIEAQETNSILFIDEIDAFLRSRDNASHSWEISQVNEFLVCLENYKGIFMAATNSTDRMDPASLRRFLYKIKFDFLDPIGVVKFYKHFFSNLVMSEMTEELTNELKTFKNLTPSDFNTVKRKVMIEEKVDHELLVSLLKLELSSKKFHNRGVIGLG